jgi:hypothetical protein
MTRSWERTNSNAGSIAVITASVTVCAAAQAAPAAAPCPQQQMAGTLLIGHFEDDQRLAACNAVIGIEAVQLGGEARGDGTRL